MEVVNDLLFGEELKIYQNTNFGTYTFDSILLANFITLKKKTTNVIDLCSGNGPIALILANKLKEKNSSVVSVEIQKELTDMLKKSCEINKLNNLEIINDDLIGISSKIGGNKFQVVSVNPPYFKKTPNANIKENKHMAIARHEILVKLEDIIIESKKLLDNTGSFYCVFRPQRLDELIVLLNKYNFTIKKIQFVYPKIDANANTILVEAKKGQVDNQMIVEKPFIVYDDAGEYTEESKKLLQLV